MREKIMEAVEAHKRAEGFFLKEENIQVVEDIAKEIIRCYRGGKKVLLFGNGGSFADAQHIAAEFEGRFKEERKPLSALVPANISALTAISNDYGYDDSFSRFSEANSKKGDVVFGISTSGNSRNVIEGIRKANGNGAITVGMTGEDGGKLRDHCRYLICVPSRDIPRIQEIHITIGHIICGLAEDGFIDYRKLVAMDVDGVVDNFRKDVPPWEENIDEYKINLQRVGRRIRRFIKQCPEAKFSLVTGRSLSSTEKILESIGINSTSIFEMGAVAYDPQRKETYVLAHQPEFERYKNAANSLNEWRRGVKGIQRGAFGEIVDGGVELRFLRDREHMVTWEITKNADSVTGDVLYRHLERNGYLDRLRDHIDSGLIRIIPSKGALDIQLGITKGDALEWVMSRYGIGADNVVCIGDSMHSDYAFMRIGRYAACPVNADETLKACVQGMNEFGYISPKSFTEGFLDIMGYLEKNW